MTDADDFFNQTLRQLGEPTCAIAGEAFVAVLKLMQTPDWIERLRAAESHDPPSSGLTMTNGTPTCTQLNETT